MTSKARKRKHISNGTNDTQNNTRKEKPLAKGKSSQGLVTLLLIMVVLTWAIAGTAYFGLINYKGLIGMDEGGNSVHVTTKDVAEEKVKSVVPNKPDENNLEVHDKTSKSSTSSKTTSTEEPEKEPKTNNNKSQKSSDKADKKTKKKQAKGSISESESFNSEYDMAILKELEKGENLLKKNSGKKARSFYENLLKSHPNSPRAMYGKGRATLLAAEEERSNQLVLDAIDILDKVGDQTGCPTNLMKAAHLLKIDKLIFLGRMKNAMQAASVLAKKLPKDVEVLNKFGVTYLYLGRNKAAKSIYERALAINPNDGFALVHYGFIVKTDGDWQESIGYLSRGINTMEPGTQQGKFYMHLGDALHRVNRTKEANEYYELGAKRGLFRSKYQRSLYNVDRLQSHPFWTPEEAKVTSYVKNLEKNWKIIRDEALGIMDTEKGLFLSEEESLKNTGDWKQLTLYAQGRRQKECDRLPRTCAIVEKMPNAIGCKRGQIKFSIMAPGTHVWAHVGPTNCRLRMHLGLIIPPGGKAKLRCTNIYKTWEEGKVLIFDDSFEHEVWQYADKFRLILIVDVWHPDLTEREKQTLSPI